MLQIPNLCYKYQIYVTNTKSMLQIPNEHKQCLTPVSLQPNALELKNFQL